MRAHPSRLLATILLLLCVPLLARAEAASGSLFDGARLKQYSENDPSKLFDDTRVTCALKHLLTADEYKTLTERMAVMNQGEQARRVRLPGRGERALHPHGGHREGGALRQAVGGLHRR